MTGLATPPDTPYSDENSSDQFDDTYDDIQQLGDMSPLPEESYSSVTMVTDYGGEFGLYLRHFTIQSGQVSHTLTGRTVVHVITVDISDH